MLFGHLPDRIAGWLSALVEARVANFGWLGRSGLAEFLRRLGLQVCCLAGFSQPEMHRRLPSFPSPLHMSLGGALLDDQAQGNGSPRGFRSDPNAFLLSPDSSLHSRPPDWCCRLPRRCPPCRRNDCAAPCLTGLPSHELLVRQEGNLQGHPPDPGPPRGALHSTIRIDRLEQGAEPGLPVSTFPSMFSLSLFRLSTALSGGVGTRGEGGLGACTDLMVPKQMPAFAQATMASAAVWRVCDVFARTGWSWSRQICSVSPLSGDARIANRERFRSQRFEVPGARWLVQQHLTFL